MGVVTLKCVGVCVKSQVCGCGYTEVYSHVCVISALSDCGEVQ